MSNIQAVTPARHGRQRWQRPSNYAFACKDAVVALVAQELPKAMVTLPIAFIAAGDSFILVALQSFELGRNLYVAPNGQWVGGYIPAAYRGYPFVMVADSDGRQTLCVDEDSGLVFDSDTGATGEAFFAEHAEPGFAFNSKPNVSAVDMANMPDSPSVKPGAELAKIFSFLDQVSLNRFATVRICATLQRYALIQPWPIKLTGSEKEQSVEGLFRIDEQRLGQLSAEELLAVRDAGALSAAYCQLLSMQHLANLGVLANAHAEVQAQSTVAAAVPVKGKDLDLSFLEGSETLKFF